jgi:hypothetical protein
MTTDFGLFGELELSNWWAMKAPDNPEPMITTSAEVGNSALWL